MTTKTVAPCPPRADGSAAVLELIAGLTRTASRLADRIGDLETRLDRLVDETGLVTCRELLVTDDRYASTIRMVIDELTGRVTVGTGSTVELVGGSDDGARIYVAASEDDESPMVTLTAGASGADVTISKIEKGVLAIHSGDAERRTISDLTDRLDRRGDEIVTGRLRVMGGRDESDPSVELSADAVSARIDLRVGGDRLPSVVVAAYPECADVHVRSADLDAGARATMYAYAPDDDLATHYAVVESSRSQSDAAAVTA
jgi:hypothetical protein